VKGYSTREVAEVLGLPRSRILAWARRGLLAPRRGPGGAYVFSFQDIVLLRTARELVAAHVPTRRVQAALASLRAQLPAGRPLSAVHVSAVGDRILVRDEAAVWEADTGQLTLDFAVSEVADRVAPIARRSLDREEAAGTLSADEWYDLALDLEAVSLDQAAEAYRQALALDPDHADAHLNLGRLLHERRRLDEAERHYRAAAEADPGSGRPLYNLGVLLEDRGRARAAVRAYEEALARDRFLATAHFNLSRLLEAEGRKQEALGHLVAYKKLLETGG